MAGSEVYLVNLAATAAAAPAATADQPALEEALEALKSYSDGSDRGALVPIDGAVAGCHVNTAVRDDLERRLADILRGGAPRAAKEYACRQLSLIGSAASVPALADLLSEKECSHIARFALQRMTCPESVKAMRESLARLSGVEKVGVIDALGMRRDGESLPVLVAAAHDADTQMAIAAVAAMGNLGTPEAALALQKLQSESQDPIRPALTDARLACAERLLAEGNKEPAVAIYKDLASPQQPKHVRLAATRGMLAAAGK